MNRASRIGDAWRQASRRIDRLDARLLVEHVCGCTHVDLIAHPECGMTEAQALRFEGLVSRRDDGRFVGWFSLKYAGASTDVEIGYRLLPEAWGQGFATEGAAAMRDHGFGPVGLSRIIGVTHPGNAASQRVLA